MTTSDAPTSLTQLETAFIAWNEVESQGEVTLDNESMKTLSRFMLVNVTLYWKLLSAIDRSSSNATKENSAVIEEAAGIIENLQDLAGEFLNRTLTIGRRAQSDA